MSTKKILEKHGIDWDELADVSIEDEYNQGKTPWQAATAILEEQAEDFSEEIAAIEGDPEYQEGDEDASQEQEAGEADAGSSSQSEVREESGDQQKDC